MAKNEVAATAAPDRFPQTLNEFLDGIPNSRAETKAGFASVCKTEGIGGNKTPEEWETLYSLFQTQPMNTTWAEWTKKGGK